MAASVFQSRAAEWIVEGWALRGEQLGAFVGDQHVVFQAHAEFSANVNAGLVAEGHVRRKRQSVAAYQVGPLVTVRPQAVANARSEVVVVGAVSGVGDHLAFRGVHSLTFHSGTRRGQRRTLRTVNDLE